MPGRPCYNPSSAAVMGTDSECNLTVLYGNDTKNVFLCSFQEIQHKASCIDINKRIPGKSELISDQQLSMFTVDGGCNKRLDKMASLGAIKFVFFGNYNSRGQKK